MGHYWICYLDSICYDMTTMIAVGMLFILLAFRYCIALLSYLILGDQHLQIEESYETSETKVTLPHSTTSPSNPISPPSPQRPSLTQASPTPTPPRAFYYRSIARMVVRIEPTLSPGYSAKLTEVMALSPSSFHTEAKSDESEDDSTNSEDDEAILEGQQQHAVPAEDTAEDEPLGLGYRAARRRALERAEDTMPSTYESGQSSRSTPDQQLKTLTPTHARLPIRTTCEDRTPPLPVRTPASPKWFPKSPPVSSIFPSLVATPSPAAVLNESVLLELGAQLELHGSILHTHTKCLYALPPSLFEGYGRDFTELLSRTEAVREEIHSQCFRLKNLERVQDETRITLGTEWRLILAFEAWAGYTEAQREDVFSWIDLEVLIDVACIAECLSRMFILNTRCYGSPVIPILSDSSEESMGSHVPRVILFGTIPISIPVIPVVPVEVPIVPADPLVAPEVGAVSVISPTRVLDLVGYCGSLFN
ncbi:hypothetical protein Tco_1185470 [Tanacetum coccineum]